MTRSSVVILLKSEWFIPALFGVIAVASLFPCYGDGARIAQGVAAFAISSLFFLQGARLSRTAIAAGIMNWRLHLGIASATFVLFPVLGLSLLALFPNLPQPLEIGFLFVCVLPSTVQSSVALTSIARGSVAGAICAATASNIVGIVLSPMMLAVLLHLHGGSIALDGLWKILLQLLVPFAAGHVLRPWIGQWADRNRAILAITDRGSILIVIYTAFSAAVINGIWHQLPPLVLVEVSLVNALLLAGALLAIKLGSHLLALPRDDEVAMIFCGSQKSLVTGVPMAQLLFAGPDAGIIVVPIMIYHQLQLLVGAWLARRYITVKRSPATAASAIPVNIPRQSRGL
jgi:sodium/bile acid cotransporter 7